MNVEKILERKGRDVATADCHITLRDAAREMRARKIGTLVLVDDQGRLAGIISERDIVRALADSGGKAAELPACDYMTKDVRVCRKTDTTAGLMAVMTENRVRHLPVMEGGALAGIVSIGDVVIQRMEEMAFEAEQMKQYIAS